MHKIYFLEVKVTAFYNKMIIYALQSDIDPYCSSHFTHLRTVLEYKIAKLTSSLFVIH